MVLVYATNSKGMVRYDRSIIEFATLLGVSVLVGSRMFKFPYHPALP
jgi:hypothetical protein